MKLLIKGGRIIDPTNGRDTTGDILVEDGKIKEIGEKIAVKADETIDATDKLVVPGLLDIHVHLREPGLEAKETIATGTRAAARGGFTSVACMPNTKPVTDNQAIIEFIKVRAAQAGVVNVFPIGAITKESKGQELAEIGDMKSVGAVAISDDGQPVMNSDVMRRAMEYAKMFDLPIISHSEDKELVAEGVMNEGYMSTVLGLKGINRAAEEVMVARDIILSEITGCPVHIAHISTAGSVRLVKEAKTRGVKVTAEVAPHHFTLTDQAVEGYNTATKVNPPLRTAEDVVAIKAGLADGTIDIIATDHAPHTQEEKDVEYNYAPFGMVGLETAVGLVFKELIEPGILTLTEAIAKLTINPAQLLRLNKGTLSVGADADITIIDPNLEEHVKLEELASKGKNTPFTGWSLKGLPVATIVGGRVVMKDRKLLC
ncbi:MAG: dihydroorotase [Thermincolia bacterium]